jgi:hypothetical protein
MSTVFDDTFASGTAGTDLAGNTASPTNNGSDTYANISGLGVMKYAGPGAIADSLTGTAGLVAYPMTGLSMTRRMTAVFSCTTALEEAVVIPSRSNDGSSFLEVLVNYASGFVEFFEYVGGTQEAHTSWFIPGGFSGGINTLVLDLNGTAFSITLNGSLVASVTLSTAHTDTPIVFGQEAGTAGHLTFEEIKVEVAPYTTVPFAQGSLVSGSPFCSVMM